MIEYRGYTGVFEYDAELEIFAGMWWTCAIRSTSRAAR
jgi:predicted HicB family RNase H-like nuclease